MPLMVSSVARHSPRISEPRLNSTSSLSARTLPRSLAPPTTTERSRSDGAGNSRASSATGDAHRRADHPRRLGLELRPELIPVDEVRPDQRGHQRNDEGNRQSEQRRLHGVSSWARSGACCISHTGPGRPGIYRAKCGGSHSGITGMPAGHWTRAAGSVAAAGRYQLAGSRLRPRSTKVGPPLGFSASSSRRSGMRRSRVEMAISASIRANWAPRQK